MPWVTRQRSRSKILFSLFYGWIFVIRHVAGFSPLLTSFFWSRTYNPRGRRSKGRRSKDIQILRVSHVILSCADQASCRKFLFSSHLHIIILEDEDGVRFLFFGLLIIFEDGIARLAPIFVNTARKLDDGDLAVLFMAWSIGDATTPYVRILPAAFFSL